MTVGAHIKRENASGTDQRGKKGRVARIARVAEFTVRVECTEGKVEEELRKANARDDRLNDYLGDRPSHDKPSLSER